jgi:hypothetical protein
VSVLVLNKLKIFVFTPTRKRAFNIDPKRAKYENHNALEDVSGLEVICTDVVGVLNHFSPIFNLT